MFIASFRLKTAVQRFLVNVREILDYPMMHPGRAMQHLAFEQTIEYVGSHMLSALAVQTAREALDLALRLAPAQGHVIECGVYKGGTIRYIAARMPSRTVHGFDSFEGLPEAWAGNTSSFDARGRLPKVPANVQLHPGWFSASLPQWLAAHEGPVAFLHIDCDIYASTRDVFAALGPRLAAGTIVVFDEYFNYPGWQQHEFRAFQEYVKTHVVTYEYLAYARIQAVIRILSVGQPQT